MKRNCLYVGLIGVWIIIGLVGQTSYGAPLDDGIAINGRITNSGGTPLSGTYSMTFRLYDVEIGGTERCSDTANVIVTNGLFSALMGKCKAEVFENTQLWLGITVGSDSEMTPRQKIGTVPYAFSLKPGAVIGGDIKQSLTGTGLVKAGLQVYCSDNLTPEGFPPAPTPSIIISSFNNINTNAFQITSGVSPGVCEITFPFPIDMRYIAVSAPYGIVVNYFPMISNFFDPTINKLLINLFTRDNIRRNGSLTILIF